MKRYTIGLITLLLIVGCSKPVKESTLINKDGIMYLPDSDKPYTGEVFTNYDTGEKLYQGTYENGLLIEYSYLKKDGSIKTPINDETLIEKDGLIYDPNYDEPYNGEFFGLYKDGGKKYTGSFNGGKPDKLLTSWYANGQKIGEATYKDGELNGPATRWYENGQKQFEGIHKDGKPISSKEWNEDGSVKE